MPFLDFLDMKMERPPLYGWFHLLWLGILIASCVLVYVFRRRFTDKAINLTLLLTGLLVILLEVYKQLVFSYKPNGGGYEWSYQWYAFPFQFCSTPMYLMFTAGILRKGKVYDALTSYLATFSLVAGIIVMLYPSTVFIDIIGINIQTMICHGSMVFIAVMLLATKKVKIEWKTLLKGILLFAIMSAIAIILNVVWHFFGTEETFNMFFISPFYPCELPLLGLVYDNVPYIVFLLIYLIGFSASAGIVLGIAKGFEKLGQRKTNEDITDKIIKIIKTPL